jgi:predicted deacetylase
MFNSIKKIATNYTGLLIRMDDISEYMNWEMMDKCESLFEKYSIKPLLGVIPINQDPELLKFPKNDKFWEQINKWKNKGWEITMHGCNHLYTQNSDKKDIFNYGGNSEFYGLDYSSQLKKIETGLKEFKKKKIIVRSFFAPNHIYDENTIKALKESEIKIVIDGYGLFPYYENEILFVPQLFYREIFLPFGIQSTQIHLNEWDNNKFKRFEIFIQKNYKKIVNLDYIISIANPNMFQSLTNYFVEKTLKTLRLFRRYS